MKITKIRQALVILVILLIINLPVVTASELNAITGNEVVSTSPSLTLNVEIPERFSDNRMEISGTTVAGARVTLFVNNALVDFDVAETGAFSFTNVFLRENEANQIVIEAVDEAGNKATFTGSVFSDTIEPSVQVNEIPELIEDTAFQLTATFSEQVSYELIVNNDSSVTGEGTSFQEQISLEEGKNKVLINFKDLAGLENTEELEIISDTQVPRVDAEIGGGEEFYEGSAVSSITGESEAGGTAYLYVYRPLANEFQPDFKQALAKTTVNDDGTFTFSEVDFEEPIISLDDLAPRQVPVELLEETSILPLDQINAQESVTYYVYIIVEDITGKTGYWYTTITVNTCFSENFDFVITSVPELQGPYRLLPSLLDEGRQKIQALFELDYHGEGIPEMRGDDIISPAYQVSNVHFTPACTRAMQEDPATAIACKILPNRETTNLISGDGSSVYVEWNLGSAAEVSERKNDFWNDFTDRRQLTFPFKVEVTYQDRLGEDEWSETKVQTSCENIGYFVDIPLESSEMIPDFLAEEGVDALDFTIEQIGNIRPVLEEVYFQSVQ